MTHPSRKYRQLTAVLLLLMYAFITTPVQLWHHHDPAKDPVGSIDQKQSIFANSHQFFSEGNCSICHHQYSTYHDDVILPVVPDLCEFSSQNGRYTRAFIYAPSFSFQNKGPPLLV
ncbi:MAG: hypothetical protein QM768_17945 [Agriterribacter sp.]